MNIKIESINNRPSFQPFQVVLEFNSIDDVKDWIKYLPDHNVSYKSASCKFDVMTEPINKITCAIKEQMGEL